MLRSVLVLGRSFFYGRWLAISARRGFVAVLVAAPRAWKFHPPTLRIIAVVWGGLFYGVSAGVLQTLGV